MAISGHNLIALCDGHSDTSEFDSIDKLVRAIFHVLFGSANKSGTVTTAAGARSRFVLGRRRSGLMFWCHLAAPRLGLSVRVDVRTVSSHFAIGRAAWGQRLPV